MTRTGTRGYSTALRGRSILNEFEFFVCLVRRDFVKIGVTLAWVPFDMPFQDDRGVFRTF